jgi:hypothetical protein
MIAVSGTLGLILLVILIGKHKKFIRPFTYSAIIIIALMQVLIVSYVMFTMINPTP